MQLFLGRFQFLVGALQLLVAGENLCHSRTATLRSWLRLSQSPIANSHNLPGCRRFFRKDFAREIHGGEKARGGTDALRSSKNQETLWTSGVVKEGNHLVLQNRLEINQEIPAADQITSLACSRLRSARTGSSGDREIPTNVIAKSNSVEMNWYRSTSWFLLSASNCGRLSMVHAS